MAIHHQCPPNHPGLSSVYQSPPTLMTPMNAKPAKAPKIPNTAA